MHTRRSWLRLAGGVCLVLSLAACGATPVGSTENTPGETPAPATPATTPEAAGNAGLGGFRTRSLRRPSAATDQ